MKRIITCLLAMALALGMFPASHTHAAETEETVAEETLVAEIPEPAEETAQAETSLPRTVAAAPKTELEKSIEKQIRAFAKSVNKPNADDDAAWEIAQHGMFKGGKKLSVGKNHVLTATLMNSELVQTALTAYCASAFQSMEHLGLDQLNAHGSLKWEGAADSFYYLGALEQKTDLADWNLVSLTDFKGKRNSYDESLDWMVGGADVDMTFKRAKVNADTVTYQLTFQISDLFDFAISGNNFFKDLISGFGALLFREFTWESKVAFDLTVPYHCSHSSGSYHWTYDAQKKTMTSDAANGWKVNAITRRTYETSSGAVSYYYELDDAVILKHDKPWVMEFNLENTGIFHLSPAINVSTSHPSLTIGTRQYFAVYDYERVMLSEAKRKELGLASRSQAIHHYYGTDLGGYFTYSSRKMYAFRLENEVKTGGNMIYLSVWETDSGTVLVDRIPMDDYYKNETWVKKYVLMDENSNWLSDKDLSVGYIGNQTYRFSADHFELWIWANGMQGEAEDHFTSKVTKPACTDKGYTTHTCSQCGYAFKDTYVDALGHTWDDGVVTQKPTEETAGVLTYTCVTCGETKTEELPTLEHTHRYEEIVTEPTCTEQGYTTYTCSCGDSYVDAYVEALGHDLSDWIEIVAPTCTQKGSERRACANCDYSEEQDLEATGHHYQSTVIAPTFTKRGYTEYVCSNCDDRYVEEESYTDPFGLPKPVVKAAQNKQTGGGILTWEADGEADSYKIYRATSSKGKYSLYKTVTEPTATVSVPVGKTYYFKVKAICEEDSTLSSPYSSIVKVTGKCAQPKVTVSNNTSGYPVIKWSKVTSAKKYWVYRATSENGKYTRVTITTKLSYTDTKATTGKTYFYKVKAVASKTTYNSVYSEIINCLKKLSKPTITLTTSQTKGTITVKWKKVTGATGYELQRKVNSGEYETVKTGTVLSYTDKNVEPGNKYTYRLKAIGSREELNNGYSSVKSATIKAGKPTVSIKLEKNKPSLSWKEAEGAVKYQVYYATSKYGKYKLLKTTEDLSYTYTSAKKGKTYYFKVRAVDQNGTAGDYSTIKSIKSK